jgi:hypothetical protein
MKYNKKVSFIFCFGILILISILPNSYASRVGDTHSVNFTQYFQITEYADENSTKSLNGSISIDLPSAGWNVSGIELNFTDIELGREIVDIETEPDTPRSLFKNRKGLGVVINITEPTKIFAVQIYGASSDPPEVNVTVQINGYTSSGYKPNNTIYGSTLININSSEIWHNQLFPSEINLNPGYYYLLINGTTMLSSDNGRINWYYNGLTPNNPNLNTTEYSGGGWQDGIQGAPFLYKLDQRVSRGYDPIEINMTAEVNGVNYQISNGTIQGTGNLTLSNLNFALPGSQLNIPIMTNQSIELTYNLSYHIYVHNEKSIPCVLTIKEGSPNVWSLTPSIQQYYNNNSVKFKIPLSWYDMEVFKNSVNITSATLNDGTYLTIQNISITNGASWEIRAKAPNKSFTLSLTKTEFEPEAILQFSATAPVIQGNFTFKLINSVDFEETSESKVVDSQEISFTYPIPKKPNEGTWNIYIFWNNNTQAGVQFKSITIIVPFTIDPEILFLIIIIIAVVAITGITAYTMVKKTKRKSAENRKKIYNKYMDTASLNYIIVTDKVAGLNIYEEFFAGKEIDPTLISGFLDAIKQFGIELSDSDSHSQTLKLDFKDSKILMVEFRNFRLIIILAETPSALFIESIRALVYDIDDKYGKSLEKFKGETTHFQGIKDLIENNLQTALISPLKVVKLEKVKISSVEKGLVNRALRIMKETNTKYFFVSSLLSQKKTLDIGDAEVILKLINKKIFQPTE